MTAVLWDDVATRVPAPKLRVVPAPALAPRPRDYQRFGGDPLTDAAARLLSIPLRQLYAVLWRVGLLEVQA